jgi:hypothetical protein
MLSLMFAAKPGRAGTPGCAPLAEILALRGPAQPARAAFAADSLQKQLMVAGC